MDETPLNPPDVPAEDLGRELAGDKADGEDRAWLTEDELDEGDEVSDTAMYEGEADSSAEGSLESLTELELRAGETNNADIAAEEGLTWVPPVDPPVIPSDSPEGIEIAAGFGTTGLDGQIDEDHRAEYLTDEDSMSARVREALRADAATSRYADYLAIANASGVIAIRGVVDDIEDTDNVLEVAGRVSGVRDVIDEMDVRALE